MLSDLGGKGNEKDKDTDGNKTDMTTVSDIAQDFINYILSAEG